MAEPSTHGVGGSGVAPAIRPLGFPACPRCPYRVLERPDVCLACAAPRMRSPAGATCAVCEQQVGADGRCPNDWCGRADRWFSVVWSIAPHTASLRRTVAAYKYQGQRGWAEILARLLVGFLDEHMPWFDGYDLLTGVPVYTGPGARRSWDHIGLILQVADRLAGPRWLFERQLVIKTSETVALAGLSLHQRRVGAEGPLRRALAVPDPERVIGRRILVVDDVFTEGSTLREVARILLLSGAVEVAGLALARQPWDGRPGRGAG